MDSDHETGPIGDVLTKLRKEAGLTQAQVAEQMKYSPAKVSRLEAGEVAPDEVSQFLCVLDTPRAREFGDFLAQPWTEIERPEFSHPNREDLWRAERILRQLRGLIGPDTKSAFVEQVKLYETEVCRAADFLRDRTHNLVFIGSIAVGKSTVICSLAGLRLPAKSNSPRLPDLAQQMALEVGGGGTTICEVRIVSGPRFGIVVEPLSDDAVRADVSDFSEYLMQAVAPGETARSKEEVAGTSQEIERAIRNMAGLVRTKKKDSSGKSKQIDPARDLARKFRDSKELAVEILTRVNLPSRQGRTTWYPRNSYTPELDWLQTTFAAINNGRHCDFPMPRLIEVVVPTAVLDCDELQLTIIDTKGIDQTSQRADLECHFDDPRSVIVLCSSFLDAPEHVVQTLLQRAKEAGNQSLEDRVCLLVLARPGEAMSVKDASGAAAVDDADGYEMKRDNQIDMALSRLGLQQLVVLFFNAMYEESGPARNHVVDRIAALRRAHAQRLHELEMTTAQLEANQEREELQAVVNKAVRRLQVWLASSEDLGTITNRVHESLISAIGTTHPRSIWASVRRNGAWSNLDYYYQLGRGTRAIAARHIKDKTNALRVIIGNLIEDDELEPTHELLKQILREADDLTDKALQRIQVAGRAEFETELRDDSEFWNRCDDEWGSGSGYRDRIASHSNRWFNEAEHRERCDAVVKLVVHTWSSICGDLRSTLARVTSE